MYAPALLDGLEYIVGLSAAAPPRNDSLIVGFVGRCMPVGRFKDAVFLVGGWAVGGPVGGAVAAGYSYYSSKGKRGLTAIEKVEVAADGALLRILNLLEKGQDAWDRTRAFLAAPTAELQEHVRHWGDLERDFSESVTPQGVRRRILFGLIADEAGCLAATPESELESDSWDVVSSYLNELGLLRQRSHGARPDAQGKHEPPPSDTARQAEESQSAPQAEGEWETGLCFFVLVLLAVLFVIIAAAS